MPPSTKTYDYGYIRTPKEVSDLQYYYNNILVSVPASELHRVKPFEVVLRERTKKTDAKGKISYMHLLEFSQQKLNPEGQIDIERIKRYCRVEDFNPGSSTQLLKYIKWRIKTLAASSDPEERKLSRTYYVPTRFKDGGETTASAELKILYEKTGDPLLDATMQYRSISTNLNNYYPGWEPGEDGRVHTTYGFVPPSGQTNTIEPNVQNLSKHTRVGQIFRRMVEASHDHYFVSVDKSRFHIVMMGREAHSARYMRFGKLDSHTIFGSWAIGERSLEIDIDNESDTDIKAKVKEIKANPTWYQLRQTIWKRVVLANQLGMGYRKLFWQDRKNFGNETTAKLLQQRLFDRFPEIEAYKVQHTQEVADSPDHSVMSPFGFIRYLYDVWGHKWSKSLNTWERRHGNDYEKALAFNIQCNSFGMMRWEWEVMDTLGMLSRFRFMNTIHDSNEFEPHKTELEACIRKVFKVMTTPCGILAVPGLSGCDAGLTVGVGVSVGRNMQDYNAETNPEGMREIEVGWDKEHREVVIRGLDIQ